MEAALPVWESDWFPRALCSFLDRDGALALAVCALRTRCHALSRALVAFHGPLAPISARDLVVCAAQHGDWDAVVALQRRCKPTSQRHLKRQRTKHFQDVLDAIEAAGGRVSCSLRAAMPCQRCHPVWLPSSVVYGAATRGRLDELKWLTEFVAFDAQKAIEAAARAGHGVAVQWLLDHSTCCSRSDDEADAQDHAQCDDQTKRIHCEIRLDDPLLVDVGVITWREELRNVAYCFVEGHGLLPPHRELRSARGYPLMDWAASEGKINLLRRLSEHPVTSTSLSLDGLVLAATRGHLHVVQWLLQYDAALVRPSLTRAMAEAARRGDREMLEWIFSSMEEGTETIGSLTAVFEAACAGGHLDVVRWVFQNCLDQRIRPRYLLMTAVAWGHLDIVKYLHEEQDYTIMGSSVAQAVAHGHLDVAKWLYGQCSAKLGDEEKAMLVPMATKSGKLAVLRWLVEDLGLWSDHAVENAAWASGDEGVQVLEYLMQRDHHQLRERLLQVSVVQLVMKGKVDVAQWILSHIPESDASPTADTVWFSSYLRSLLSESGLHNKMIVGLFIRCRPRFCATIKRLPVWAASRADIETLEKLEAISHPRLLTDSVLRAIINCTRDSTVMLWFLQRRSLSPKQYLRVSRWAAQYCALSVLQHALDAPSLSAHDRFRSLRIAAWHGARLGHHEVLQAVTHSLERSLSQEDHLGAQKVWIGIANQPRSHRFHKS